MHLTSTVEKKFYSDNACIKRVSKKDYSAGQIVGEPIRLENKKYRFNFTSYCFPAIMANNCGAVAKDKQGKVIAAAPNILKF